MTGSVCRPLITILSAAALALGLTALTACGSDGTSEPPDSRPTPSTASGGRTSYPLTVENCGRRVTLERAPRRVLVSQDETALTLIRLGLGDRIVGRVTRFYDLPGLDPELRAQIDRIPLLGKQGTASVSAEQILATRPDLIYTTQIVGFFDDSRTALISQDRVRQVGAELIGDSLYCAKGDGVDATLAHIRELGRIFDVQERADTLAATIQSRLDRVSAEARTGKERPTVAILDYIDKQPFINNTPRMAEVVDRVGARLAFAGAPTSSVSREVVASTPVDALGVIAYQKPGLAFAGTQEERARRFFSLAPSSRAARDRHVFTVPSPTWTSELATTGERVADALKETR
jgi:iron complex transport system substrate-binding protein